MHRRRGAFISSLLDANVNAIPPYELAVGVGTTEGHIQVTYHDEVSETRRDAEVPLILPSQLLTGNQVVSDVRLGLTGDTLSIDCTTAKGAPSSTSINLPPGELRYDAEAGVLSLHMYGHQNDAPLSTKWERVTHKHWLALDEELTKTRRLAEAGAAALGLATAHAATDLATWLNDTFGIQELPDIPDLPEAEVSVEWDNVRRPPLTYERLAEVVTFDKSAQNFMPGKLYLGAPVYYGLRDSYVDDSRLLLDPAADKVYAAGLHFREGHGALHGDTTVYGDLSIDGSANILGREVNVFGHLDCNSFSVSGQVPALSYWTNDVPIANANVTGWLSNVDHNTFSSKQTALYTDADSYLQIHANGYANVVTWQADWLQGNVSSPSYIHNKPGLANVTHHGLYPATHFAVVSPLLGNLYSTNANIGIGTSAPERKLHIHDTSGACLKLSSSSRSLELSCGHDGLPQAALTYSAGSSFKLGEQLIIDSSGRVGISTQTPTHNLHIRGSALATKGYYLLNGDPGKSLTDGSVVPYRGLGITSNGAVLLHGEDGLHLQAGSGPVVVKQQLKLTNDSCVQWLAGLKDASSNSFVFTSVYPNGREVDVLTLSPDGPLLDWDNVLNKPPFDKNEAGQWVLASGALAVAAGSFLYNTSGGEALSLYDYVKRALQRDPDVLDETEDPPPPSVDYCNHIYNRPVCYNPNTRNFGSKYDWYLGEASNLYQMSSAKFDTKAVDMGSLTEDNSTKIYSAGLRTFYANVYTAQPSTAGPSIDDQILLKNGVFTLGLQARSNVGAYSTVTGADDARLTYTTGLTVVSTAGTAAARFHKTGVTLTGDVLFGPFKANVNGLYVASTGVQVLDASGTYQPTDNLALSNLFDLHLTASTEVSSTTASSLFGWSGF